MEQVDRCRKEDIPTIAKLHLRVYGNSGHKSTEQLESHYEMFLFANPWCDKEIPSLVFRSKEGRVDGFIGVVVRKMIYNGKLIRMAVPHDLMVAPDCGSPMAAILLIRKLLSGPQELVMGSANDSSKKLMEAMGVSTSYAYSMNWLSVLRPCSFMRDKLEAKRRWAAALLSVCVGVDVLVSKARRASARALLKKYSGEEMDAQSLLHCVKELSKGYALYPDYSAEEIEWLWSYLGSTNQRGFLQGIQVRDKTGSCVGAYLYYFNTKKSLEIMFLGARDGSAQIVFRHLLDHASSLGAIRAEGRVEPRFVQSISDSGCFLKHRFWAILDAKNPEILNTINRGDALFSALDGEFVFHSPDDL